MIEFRSLQRDVCLGVSFLGLLVFGCGRPMDSESDAKIYQSVDLSLAPDVVTQSTVYVESTRAGASKKSACTGTVVSTTQILTAAHCCNMAGAQTQYKVAFLPNIKNIEPTLAQSRIVPASLVKSFDAEKRDLCVLKIPSIPSTHRPAFVETTKYPIVPDEQVVLAGFGNSQLDGHGMGELRWGMSTAMGVLSDLTKKNPELKKGALYEDYVLLVSKLKLAPGQVERFDDLQDGSNALPGDSGGPVYRFRDGQWRLAGVISAGDPAGKITMASHLEALEKADLLDLD